MRLFLRDKHRAAAVVALIGEAVEGEACELRRIGHAVSDQPRRHGAAAFLCPHRRHGDLIALGDKEVWLDDPDLSFDTAPVEQLPHLRAGQVDEHTVVSLDAVDERVGQPAASVFEHRPVMLW